MRTERERERTKEGDRDRGAVKISNRVELVGTVIINQVYSDTTREEN